jgi:hypothetical protein
MADYWENWGPSPGKALQVLLHELCLKKGWKVSYVKLNPFGNLQSVEALNSPATTMKEAEPFEANPQQYLYELHLFQGSEQPTVFQNLEPRNLKGEAKADLAEQCLIHLGYVVINRCYLSPGGVDHVCPNHLAKDTPMQMVLQEYCKQEKMKIVFSDKLPFHHFPTSKEMEILGHKHPLYRTKMCTFAVDDNDGSARCCHRGSSCPFAHTDAELRPLPVDAWSGAEEFCFELDLHTPSSPPIKFRNAAPMSSRRMAKADVALQCIRHLGLSIHWTSYLKFKPGTNWQEGWPGSNKSGWPGSNIKPAGAFDAALAGGVSAGGEGAAAACWQRTGCVAEVQGLQAREESRWLERTQAGAEGEGQRAPDGGGGAAVGGAGAEQEGLVAVGSLLKRCYCYMATRSPAPCDPALIHADKQPRPV